MKKFKNLIATILTLAMTISLFTFPIPALGADEAEDYVLFTAKRKADVTNTFSKLTADSKYIKNSKFSAKWTLADVASLTMKVPKDLTVYNEFKATIYSTAATTFYAYFITDNSDSDGMDYYGKLVKLTEGWNEISVPFSKMETSRKPSWGNISSFAINATGFGQEAPDPKTTIYIDHMALSKNLDLDDVTAPTPEPSREPLPEGVVGTARYMENDFAPEQKIPTGSSYDNKIERREENGNYYMHVEKTNSSQVHTDFTVKNASRYVVMQADFASKNVPGGTFISVRSNTANTIMLSFSKEGKLTAGGQEVGSLDLKKGTYTNIALAFDFGEGIYSVYIDGKLKAKDIKISGNPYHASMIYRIFLGAGDYMGAYMDVDNIKIFDGKTPADFENTESLEVTQEKLFESLRGSKSGIIDYGDKVVARVDAQKAVAMNVHSGYIHANGQRTMPDTPAYIKNGRTLLPVRAVSEALGCEVGWDDATKTVTINGNAKIVIGSTNMTLPNGGSYTLDVPAEITNGRTFIPLRALCEQILGKKVFWDDRGLIVLSDAEMVLTEDDITNLNNYMLYVRPSGDELAAALQQKYQGTHPRAIFDRQGFDNMIWRYNSNEIVRRWGDDLISIADGLLVSPHEKYVVESDGQILNSARNLKARVFALYFAYEFTKDYKYIPYLIDELMAAAAWEDWAAKTSFLDTGELTMGMAIGYDWTYNFLTEEQKKYLEDRIYQMSAKWFHMAQYNVCDYANHFITTDSNWNAVCNGGMGVTAIALMDVNPEIYSDILEKTLVSFEAMMSAFYPDGAWFETVSYLIYLTQFTGYYFTALNTVYGTDFNLSKAPGYDKTGTFYFSMDGMTGANNYHDSGSTSHLMSPYLYFLSNIHNQPQLTELTMYKFDTYSSAKKGTYMTFSSEFDSKVMQRIASLMYYNPYITPADTINYALDSHFRGPELVNMRSSWTDNEGIYLSAHSGENSVNHGHLDAGTFVLDIGGERFAGDIGAESYTAKYYWTDGNKRYFYYRANPQGHNVFVINPDTTHGQYKDGIEKFTTFESKERGAYAVTSMKSYYKPYAEDAQRGFMLADERRSAIIRDEIRGMKKDENTVYWFMQMEDVEAEILDSNTAILTKNGVKVKMQVLSDAKAQEILITDPVVLENTYVLNGDDMPNPHWKRLAIKMTTGKDLNITVKFSRYCDPIGDTPIVDTPIANWTIPDGPLPVLPEVPDFPLLSGINLNGQSAVKNFDGKATYHMAVLPFGTTQVPAVEAVCGADATAKVTLPSTLPGEATIEVVSTVDARLKNTYTLFMRAANDIELEVSAEQEGNGGDKCMDGDLSTRWAVEGESYGIFTFATPKAISSVWIATWKAAERQLKFDIEVSTDGVNFTQVFSGMTQAKEDILEEVKIPAGTYKAVKLVMHGTTTGAWNSVLEIDFK